MMDVDSDSAAAASNVDDWLACFSAATNRPGAFPFTKHKIQSIESRRARMSDLLLFDVLLIRGGMRGRDMLFPPTDWTALRKLLDAIDESAYDILKKDCLVYILLKWVWDMDPRETNPGWDARYLQDRCIAPQFAALADAYWLLDTGTHLAKAVSILSDARLNRDYVSKVLQALALSSSPASFASGTAPATAALVVKYVRTAKPLLTQPDDIDLYALSLAQLSFMDAWSYQKSFPEGGDTRERLLRKIVGWCLMPTPKQEPLAQLLALPLSLYEQSLLHSLAFPSQFTTSTSLSSANMYFPSGPVLSSHAISILQDFLCVRAIQSGDYVGAIKLDRQFTSVPLGSGASSSNIASQATSSGRDTIDRKSIIQDLFATLPPAERTLLEDEIGRIAAGVRANASTPRQATSAARRLPMAEMSLSGSWEDVGAGTSSPAPSTPLSSSAASAGFTGKVTPGPVSATIKVNHPSHLASTSTSPFASRVARPQQVSIHQAPPTPKFTAFGSPIPPSTGVSAGRGVISERGKTLFSTSTAGGQSTSMKPATRVSLFDTAGSAKNAPNAFYKPPSAPTTGASLNVASALGSSGAAKGTMQSTTQNGRVRGSEDNGEDASMESDPGVNEAAGREEHHEEPATDADEENAGNFIMPDQSGAADLTFRGHDVMDEDDGVGVDLGFSLFNGSKSVAQNGSAGGHGKRSGNGNGNGNGHVPRPSLSPRARVSPSREGDEGLNTSTNSTTSRWRAPPGAFDPEEEDDEARHENEEKARDDEDDQGLRTTPTSSRRQDTRTKTQGQTPLRPSARSQPQRSSKSTTMTTGSTTQPSTHTRRTSSSRPRPSQPIPGALMEEDNEEHDTDGDTEMDEQDEEVDAIAPLPSRTSRRTRSSGLVDASTSIKSRPSAKSAPVKASATAAGTATAAKGKAKARSSEPRTPARRSSRLSTASLLSPDPAEVASPTKKGRKSTGARASAAGNASGTVATRSSTRLKR